ncbi:MAG: SDR family oxidoreductase [Candidatus Omnitrophica bacterium]|nr:SDR family oxidoreductase [Candidatus Omnitrophota bacterium]
MRVLIFGGSGMLGHKLWQYLSVRFPEIFVVIRQSRRAYKAFKLFEDPEHVVDTVDAFDFSVVERVLGKIRPDVILNCIGITKRHEMENDSIASITLNSLFPHKLVKWGHDNNAKVISFSTDCVFDGKAGNYTEKSLPCAEDMYGKTKALGELKVGNVLTLRSSFIGPELSHGSELLEWFLAQTGTVKGFRNAVYSGLTTLELCRVVEKIIFDYPEAKGLYQVSSDPITKFDLLSLIKKKMGLSIEIIPEDNFYCNRSLDSSRFREEFNYAPPSWETMIDELAAELKGKKR